MTTPSNKTLARKRYAAIKRAFFDPIPPSAVTNIPAPKTVAEFDKFADQIIKYYDGLDRITEMEKAQYEPT